MSDELRDWLSEVLKQRSWSHRELARRTDISQSLVSKTLAGDMRPSADFCIKVAQALNEPPEKILRLANILPPVEEDSIIEEMIGLIRNMTPKQRQQALKYLRFLYKENDDTA